MVETLGLLSLAFIPAFMVLDLVYGAREYDAPRWYRLRGFMVTAAVIGGSIVVATFWGNLFDGYSLLNGAELGLWAGAGAGILGYELVHYAYHRAAHRFDWLWRLGHQMHHSTEKLDAFGANYLHPVDLVFFTTWSSLVFFPVLGLLPEAGAIAATWVAFNAMFQHANIRTPHWLGYVIQRPESHIVHHGRGRHHQNYANLPLWDMLFGTFNNPRDVDGIETGFYRGASARIGDMLLFRDVSRPVEPARQAEATLHDAA
ncbi:MAG: sterol desaturase family protein [Woeseiaceae bacterium]|nr:sterol desaturase family protein [Woeseiaceae bacterium]